MIEIVQPTIDTMVNILFSTSYNNINKKIVDHVIVLAWRTHTQSIVHIQQDCKAGQMRTSADDIKCSSFCVIWCHLSLHSFHWPHTLSYIALKYYKCAFKKA